MAVTGKPPTVQEVEAYGNHQFGTDKSKWPAEYRTLYTAVQPRAQLGIVPRATMAVGAYGLQHALGMIDNPVVTPAIQAATQGIGEFGSRIYRGDEAARATYPPPPPEILSGVDGGLGFNREQ